MRALFVGVILVQKCASFAVSHTEAAADALAHFIIKAGDADLNNQLSFLELASLDMNGDKVVSLQEVVRKLTGHSDRDQAVDAFKRVSAGVSEEVDLSQIYEGRKIGLSRGAGEALIRQYTRLPCRCRADPVIPPHLATHPLGSSAARAQQPSSGDCGLYP